MISNVFLCGRSPVFRVAFLADTVMVLVQPQSPIQLRYARKLLDRPGSGIDGEQ